jgi:MFS family permease
MVNETRHMTELHRNQTTEPETLPASPAEPAGVAVPTGPVSPTTAVGALKEPLFRSFWVAALASNLGLWMTNVAAAWLMTDLSDSSTLVALVQTATYLPMFLVGLLAGALADVTDRRRILLAAQATLAVTAVAMGLLTLRGAMTPTLLLALTFVIGFGTALLLPAWQAVIPETVRKEAVPSAVALNAASLNVARATGPALGGLIIAVAATGWVFLAGAWLSIGLIVALFRWQRQRPEPTAPVERVGEAVRAGGRYIRHSPNLKAVLVRTAIFTLFASAIWALLPLVSRGELQLDAAGYGGLLACLGLGAASGAAFLPGLQARVSLDLLVAVSSTVFAGVLVALAYLEVLPLLAALLAFGGFAWVAVLANFTTATTTSAPAWVRARAMGIYLLVLQGGLALGSALWGALAQELGRPTALVVAAAGLVVTLPAGARWRVDVSRHLDLTPSPRRNELNLVGEPALEAGPVLVLLDYRIDPAQADDFLLAVRRLGRIRRRDGASTWGVFRDSTDSSRYLESFVVESWAEYLRQRERLTVADVAVQEQVRSFHRGDGPPRVLRFIDPGAGRPRLSRRKRTTPLI